MNSRRPTHTFPPPYPPVYERTILGTSLPTQVLMEDPGLTWVAFSLLFSQLYYWKDAGSFSFMDQDHRTYDITPRRLFPEPESVRHRCHINNDDKYPTTNEKQQLTMLASYTTLYSTITWLPTYDESRREQVRYDTFSSELHQRNDDNLELAHMLFELDGVTTMSSHAVELLGKEEARCREA